MMPLPALRHHDARTHTQAGWFISDALQDESRPETGRLAELCAGLEQSLLLEDGAGKRLGPLPAEK